MIFFLSMNISNCPLCVSIQKGNHNFSENQPKQLEGRVIAFNFKNDHMFRMMHAFIAFKIHKVNHKAVLIVHNSK